MGYGARLQGIFLALVGDSWHYNRNHSGGHGQLYGTLYQRPLMGLSISYAYPML